MSTFDLIGVGSPIMDLLARVSDDFLARHVAGDKGGMVLVDGREMQRIISSLDNRPTVTANNHIGDNNQLLKSDITDLIGYNYHHESWAPDQVQKNWGQKPFIVTESVSAIQSRGHYDMPSDSMHIWPQRWDLPVKNANTDLTCSAYENCYTPWGATHMATLKTF